MNFKRILLLGTVFTMFAGVVSAQDATKPKRYWSVGVHAGVAQPYTDLTQYSNPGVYKAFNFRNENKFGIGVNASKQVGRFLSVRAQGFYTKLQGVKRNSSDEARKRLQSWGVAGNGNQGVYFKSNITQGALALELNLRNLGADNSDKKMQYYLLAGVGVTAYDVNIYTVRDGIRVEDPSNFKSQFGVGSNYKWFVGANNKDKNLGYGSAFTVPVGGGIRYKVNKTDAIGLEVVQNLVFTDYIDGLADTKDRTDDKYFFGALTFTHTFKSVALDEELQELAKKTDSLNNRIDSLITALKEKEDQTDTDGDGIADKDDVDPYSVRGAKVDAKGKTLDSDGDGVPDGLDKEENTKAGSLVNFEGRTIPTIKETNTNNNQNTKTEPSVAYFPSVFFATNSAVVTDNEAEKLAIVALMMKVNTSLKLKLVGFADQMGDADYNKTLSQKRVDAVKEYLTKNFGIDGGRVEIEAKGETEALSPNVNAVNRRVDIMPK